MNAERWDRVTDIFHHAAALIAENRPAYLDRACAGDAEMRADVERFLAAADRAGNFMEQPAIAGLAGRAADPSDPTVAGQRFGPYQIIREIGRGGMGTVYLAERADGQFEQRVALKLIKRGMDSDLVLERFRAERQILASLEHPNIARLLDGGSAADGRPYFVMEYIDGRPLDEYADQMRLGVPERLRLFLAVSDAVDYAHRHHVIHRDIKPINILVTAGGVPKLLDFGIAKMLDPEAGDPTASMTGVRLLTPEYASPEQVDGRHATAASDVYSLGVVLYELLTGSSPYRLLSRSAADVSEAVRTTDPERPSVAVMRSREAGVRTGRRASLQEDRAAATGSESADKLRRKLSGDLDTIVLMALQKEPGRRYPSVEEFAGDIRRHLQGKPVRARPNGVRYRAGKFVRRHRAVLATAVLAAIPALLLPRFLDSRRDSRLPPSLIATGVLAARDRILVTDFADRAGDPTLAAALTEAFEVGLSQSSQIQLLSPRQVRSALTRMQRSADVALDDSLAREVAVREGVKAIVTGRVDRVAGRYTISAALVSADRGDLLAAFQEIAADTTELIRAVDRLSARVSGRIGEPLQSMPSPQPLEQVTTASLRALRGYTEGYRAIVAGDRERGLKLLTRAIAIDTGFASAHRLLGLTYEVMVERGRADDAMAHAIANQSRLPFYERYHLLANRASGLGDFDRASEAYRHILERFPNDVRALNNLGWIHGLRREYAAEDSLLVRALAVDSTLPSVYLTLAIARINSGDYASARRAIDLVNRRFPGNPSAALAEIYLAASSQDWVTAEQKNRARLAAVAGDSADAVDALETMAGIVMTQGRLREAERHSRLAIAVAGRQASPGRRISSTLRLASIELRYRKRPAAALRIVDDLIARFPLDSIPVGDRAYDELARFYAAAGRPERSRELLAGAERSGLGRLQGPKPDRRWTLGTIAMAERRLKDAVAELGAAARLHECGICPLPDLGRAYEAAGLADSAIAVYQRYITLPWEWRFEPDGTELGFAFNRLGELYAEQARPDLAADAFRRLLRLWHAADAELEPVLADARHRLARTGSSGTR